MNRNKLNNISGHLLPHLLMLIICMAFFYSCENVIIFRSEDTEPKIVFNSIIENNTNIYAKIYKSQFFIDLTSQFEEIDDAKVALWVNNEFIETLSHEQGFYNAGEYFSVYTVKEGDKIDIRVTAEDLKDISCSTEIVPSLEIISLDTEVIKEKGPLIGYNDKFIEYKFNLKFKDHPGKRNYYRLDVKLAYYTDNTFFYSGTHTLLLTDPVFEYEYDETGGYIEEYLYQNMY